MLRTLGVLVVLFATAFSQDIGDITGGAGGSSGGLDVFNGLMHQLAQQWGEISTEEYQQFFQSWSQSDYHHIWTGLEGHCSSNKQCGPDACCMKPHITGRRAVNGGHNIHFASYCAKLRDVGETCSNYVKGAHFYNFHCPCKQGAQCVAGGTVSLHPLIQVQTNSYCKSV